METKILALVTLGLVLQVTCQVPRKFDTTAFHEQASHLINQYEELSQGAASFFNQQMDNLYENSRVYILSRQDMVTIQLYLSMTGVEKLLHEAQQLAQQSGEGITCLDGILPELLEYLKPDSMRSCVNTQLELLSETVGDARDKVATYPATVEEMTEDLRKCGTASSSFPCIANFVDRALISIATIQVETEQFAALTYDKVVEVESGAVSCTKNYLKATVENIYGVTRRALKCVYGAN